MAAGLDSTTIIIIGVGTLATILLSLAIVYKCYKRSGPNQAMIVSGALVAPGGRNRIVINGGMLVWPIIQQVSYLNLEVASLDLTVTDAYTKFDQPANVTAVVQFKIQDHPEGVSRAAERFLGNEAEIPKAVERILKTQLLAHFRTESLPDIFADRGVVTSHIIEDADDELEKLGLDLVSLDLTDISDESGSLGG